MRERIDMKPVHAATAEDFNDSVLNAQALVLVDFWASWCAPCRALAPVLEDLANDYAGDVAIVKVDVEAAPTLAKTYNIGALPSMLLFRDGVEIRRIVGAQTRTRLAALLDDNL